MANSQIGQRSGTLCMRIDSTILEKAGIALFNDMGDLEDLPSELRNTLSNVYYKFFILGENPHDPNGHFHDKGTDLISAHLELIRNGAVVLADFKCAKGLIDSLRSIRKSNPELNGNLLTCTLDVLKYHIEKVEVKTPIRRAMERMFKKHEEISDLYRQMQPIFFRMTSNKVALGPIQWRNLNSTKRTEDRFKNEPSSKQRPSDGNASFAFSPTMPDVSKRKPTRAFQLGEYWIFLVKDAPMAAEGNNSLSLPFKYMYPYTMIVTNANRVPRYFVTLEVLENAGVSGKPFLCAFAPNGDHPNLGAAPELLDETKFIERAILVIRNECGVSELPKEITDFGQ
jgi:hypothetical protein